MPSLLVIFKMRSDPKLSNKLLDLTMKLYNQRKEFANRLNELVVLFDPNDIHLFKSIKKKIQSLNALNERAEVKLIIYKKMNIKT